MNYRGTSKITERPISSDTYHPPHNTKFGWLLSNWCISSVPLALFVMLDEELKSGFSMKVMKRKTLTPSVVVRFDPSMPS